MELEPCVSEALLGNEHIFRDFTRGWVSITRPASPQATGSQNDRGVHLAALEAGIRRWRCWQGWFLRLHFHRSSLPFPALASS